MQGIFPWIFKVGTGYQITRFHDSEEHYMKVTLVFMYGSYSVYTSAAWRRIKEAGTLFCLKTAFNAASQFMNHESCLSADSHIAPHEIFITWRKPFSSVCRSLRRLHLKQKHTSFTVPCVTAKLCTSTTRIHFLVLLLRCWRQCNELLSLLSWPSIKIFISLAHRSLLTVHSSKHAVLFLAPWLMEIHSWKRPSTLHVWLQCFLLIDVSRLIGSSCVYYFGDCSVCFLFYLIRVVLFVLYLSFWCFSDRSS